MIRDITIDDDGNIPQFDWNKISKDKIPVELFTPSQLEQIRLIMYVYHQSVVNYEELYKMMVLVSYKTANNQYDCENMPYWKFANMITLLNDIIEQENGKSGNHDDAMSQYNDMKGDMKGDIKTYMKSATSGMSKITSPKITMPKF